MTTESEKEIVRTDSIEVQSSPEAAEAVSNQLPDVVQSVVDEIDRAANSEYIQVTASRVTPSIGSSARNVIYTIGFYAGIVGTVAPMVAAYFTGDAQIIIASIGAIGLSLTNLLAKLNLSKTADDLAKEQEKGYTPQHAAG